MREGLAVCGGRHHFSPSSSFNAALSNMASARSRFCRVFSSSSDFSAWPRKPPSRRTWPSICKSWRRSSRVYGTARQPKLPPHVPSKPDDLLFRKPAALHNPVLHSVRILPSVGGNSGGTSRGSSAVENKIVGENHYQVLKSDPAPKWASNCRARQPLEGVAMRCVRVFCHRGDAEMLA